MSACFSIKDTVLLLIWPNGWLVNVSIPCTGGWGNMLSSPKVNIKKFVHIERWENKWKLWMPWRARKWNLEGCNLIMPNYVTVTFFFLLCISKLRWEERWSGNVNLTSSKHPNDNRCFRKSGSRKTAPIQGRYRGWCYCCYLYCASVDMLCWCMVCLCVPPLNLQIRTLLHWRKLFF